MNWYYQIKTAEVSLYHGTLLDNLSSIKQNGLIPMLGQFVQDAYGSEYEDAGLDIQEEISEVIYAADKLTIDKALSAIKHHISGKLGKSFHDVTANDLRNHGLLVKIKGEGGSKNPPPPFEQRPEEYDQEWEMNAADQKLYGVEPRDYYSTETMINDIEFIYGPALVRFLKRSGLILIGIK